MTMWRPSADGPKCRAAHHKRPTVADVSVVRADWLACQTVLPVAAHLAGVCRPPPLSGRLIRSLLETRMRNRRRADLLLVERGLFDSRAKAQAAIAAGLVTADDVAIARASEAVAVDGALRPQPAVLWALRRGGE